MSYYRIAIVAPMEVSEDDPSWRCFESLRLAGHAVEIVDPRTFPFALRSDGSVDDDALRPFLERFRPDVVSLGDESAQSLVERLERSGAKGSDRPWRRFVIFGYVGPGNFGDELIFSLICREIEGRWPGAQVELIGHDPAATLRRHGVVSVTTDRKLEADIMLSGADALVFMAGIMFDDPFEWWSAGPVDPFLNPRSEIGGQAAFTLMAAARGVPSYFLGIGAGPLRNPDARRLVRLESTVGAHYLPRDETTERLLLEAGVPASSVERKADLAFLLDPSWARGTVAPFLEKSGLAPGSYMAVSLREHRTVPEGFARTVAEALDEAWEREGIPSVLVDLAPEDAAIHRAVRDAMRRPEAAVALAPGDDERLVVDLLANARCALAMRLHCSIVANACGVPSAGFDYNEKVGAYYRLAGSGDSLLPMDASAADIAAALGRLERDSTASDSVARFRKLALQAFDRLEEGLGADPPRQEPRTLYPRSISLEELALRDAERSLDGARQEVESLRHQLGEARAECDELLASTTWKAGRAVTALPRALKDALLRARR